MSFLSWKGAKIYYTYSHITQPYHMCIKYPQNAILRTHQICYTLMVKKIITLSAMCIPSKND